MTINITSLPPADSLTGTELTIVVQGGVSKKAAVSQIVDNAASPAQHWAEVAESAAINASTSASNASLSQSAASTSANAASNSATASSNSASASAASASDAASSRNTAISQATAATNSANASAASASAASGYATTAQTQASLASDSATTATTKAGIATTQAGIATTKAAQAATSETNAAASASTATTQAGTATSAASTATTQAGIATTQAGIAATQATSATNSATNAATSAGQASTYATNSANSATASANSATQSATSAASAAAIVLGVASNRASIRPSLLLDFANTKVLDPRVTFGRASTATYYDGKTSVKAEENLLTYSEQFDNAAWTKSNATVTANATTAPDGTSTADKLVENSSNGLHYTVQSATCSTGAYSFSIYLQAAGRTKCRLNMTDNVTGSCYGTVDLSAATIAITSDGTWTGATGTIVSTGSGWYRVTVTGTRVSGTSVGCRVDLQDASGNLTYTGDGTSGVYIWGAQLEQRSQATAYTATTTSPITNYVPALQTSAANIARFDHDPITGESKGLLIEEQRTNLLSASSDFETPVWTKSNATVNANCVVAPDGTLTADKLVEDTSNAFHAVQQIFTSTGIAYTVSAYVKSAERTAFAFRNVTAGQTIATFDLSLATATTSAGGSSSSITALGNGWFRCIATFTPASGSTQLYLLPMSGASTIYTGNGTSGIYIWGAQLEAGAFATSYVATPVTFTSRSTTATYRGTNGLIQTASSNVARYEPNSSGGSNLLLEGAATNLLTRSEDFSDAVWTKTNATISADATTAPDGLNTADKLVEDTATNIHRFYQTQAAANGTYTFSCYLKAAGRSKAFIIISDATTGSAGIWVDLSAATFSYDTASVGSWTSISGAVVSIGNGWCRCSVTGTKAAGSNALPMVLTSNGVAGNSSTSYTGDGTSGIYVWGAQLETGSVATSYVPSVETFTSRASTATYYGSNGLIQTAATNVARINYNPANLSVPGKLLLEPAATNLLTYSSDLTGVDWSVVTGVSVTSNTDTAPDGTITADTVTITATGDSRLQRNMTVSNDSTTYTASVFIKKTATKSYGGSLTLRLLGGTSITSALAINTTTGTILSGAGIVADAGTYWRVSVTATNNSSGNTTLTVSLYPSTTGGVGEGNTYWGAQLETGTSATSYIPTTTAQVTRAADVSSSAQGTRAADVYSAPTVTRVADVATMTGTNFSSWWNASEGTIYTDCASFGSAGYASVAWDGTNNNYIINRVSSSGTAMVVSSGGSIQTNIGSSALVSKIAAAYKANDFAVSVNGGAVATDTSGTVPVVNQLSIGSNNANHINGTIKRITYYPKRLSNTELQALTA